MNTLSNEEIYALLSKKVNSLSTGGSSVKSESDIVTVHFTGNNGKLSCDKDYEEIKNISKTKFVIAVFMEGILYPLTLENDVIFFDMCILPDTEEHPCVFYRKLTNTDGSWVFNTSRFEYEKIKEYLEESDFAKKSDLPEIMYLSNVLTDDDITQLSRIYNKDAYYIKMATKKVGYDLPVIVVGENVKYIYLLGFFYGISDGSLKADLVNINKTTLEIKENVLSLATLNDLLEYQHEVITATETMGQITVQSFTSNAVQSLLSILNDYPNKTIEAKLTSSTFSNTTMILELTQYTDTEVHFTGDCFINGKFVFMDLKVDSTDTWTFTSKQYTEVS